MLIDRGTEQTNKRMNTNDREVVDDERKRTDKCVWNNVRIVDHSSPILQKLNSI